MQHTTRGICEVCLARVPAHHAVRDGKVYLCKDCPNCGPTEHMVSTDAAVWQDKRDMWGYEPGGDEPCSMRCSDCNVSHAPAIVFLDVTNRCNMNCPICIANVPGMGFDFHPSLEYFDRVFKHVSTFRPRPILELFGGEPTVRQDLTDVIKLARSYGLRSRVVTNGLRLADEAYCEELCRLGVRFRIALDGRTPEIYQRLRSNPGACDKKLKAIDNLRKYSRRKNSLLCCAAKGVNDVAIADLIACCHENMGVINELALLPLAETWEEGAVEGLPATTPEDAEQMIKNAVEGGGVEFIPAGLMHHVLLLRSFFRDTTDSDRLQFAGVHPNCESLALLVSDGQQYRSFRHYFRMPFRQLVEEAIAVTQKLEPRLRRLDRAKLLQRLSAQLVVVLAFLPLARRAVDLKRLFRGHPVLNFARMAGALLTGRKSRKSRDFFYKYMDSPRLLRVIILPFEEPRTIDAGRLRSCKAAFAYEDVDTGTIRTAPACTWTLYRDNFLRKIAAKYQQPKAAVPPSSLVCSEPQPVKRSLDVIATNHTGA